LNLIFLFEKSIDDYDNSQLRKQEMINQRRLQKKREQEGIRKIDSNRFIAERTKHVSGLGTFIMWLLRIKLENEIYEFVALRRI
jgi:hypothetical protein